MTTPLIKAAVALLRESTDEHSGQPSWLNGEEGHAFLDHAMKHVEHLTHHIGDLDDDSGPGHELYHAADHDDDVSAEEDDHYGHPTYPEWEKRKDASSNEVAKRAVALRDHIARHVEKSQSALAALDKHLAKFASQRD